MLSGTSKRSYKTKSNWTVQEIIDRKKFDCPDWSSIEERKIEKKKHWIQNKSFKRWVLKRVSVRSTEEDSTPDLSTRDHNIVCLAMLGHPKRIERNSRDLWRGRNCWERLPAHPKRNEIKSRKISKWRVKGRVVVHNVEKQLKWTVASAPRESQALELISALQLSPLCQSWKNEWKVLAAEKLNRRETGTSKCR